tara:strand:- start:115 stop:987 length:873 start_codon:yes stop_codon:yes gene_type:complete
MSKSDDEKAALQSDSGLGSLAGSAGGGIRVPGDFFDGLTRTVTPREVSADAFKDYVSGGSDYGGGYSQTATTSGGTAGVPLEMIVTAKQMPSTADRFGPGGLTTLTGGDFSVGPDFGNLGIGMGNMGNFDPTGSLDPISPFKPKGKEQDGFLKRLIKGYARINPKTAPFMLLKDLKDAFQESGSAGEFGRNFLKRYATQALTNKLGLSPLQRQGISLGLAAKRGQITPGQGLGSLATSYGFGKLSPGVYKDIYKSSGGDMNQVYLAGALLNELQGLAQRKIFQPGPGGDG